MKNNLEDLRKTLLNKMHYSAKRQTRDWSRAIGITAKDLIAFLMLCSGSEETINKIKKYLNNC